MTALVEPPGQAVRVRLPWWRYETSVESLGDLDRVRRWVRSRLAHRPGVRVVDLLLIMDVLLLDGFGSGFAQRDLRLTVTIDGARLVVALEAADAPVTIGPGVDSCVGRAVLDVVATDWGVHRQQGLKTTWAVLDTGPRNRH